MNITNITNESNYDDEENAEEFKIEANDNNMRINYIDRLHQGENFINDSNYTESERKDLDSKRGMLIENHNDHCNDDHNYKDDDDEEDDAENFDNYILSSKGSYKRKNKRYHTQSKSPEVIHKQKIINKNRLNPFYSSPQVLKKKATSINPFQIIINENILDRHVVNEKEVEFLFRQRKFNSCFQSILAFISISSGIMYYELSFSYPGDQSYESNDDLPILWINFLITIFLLITIVFDHYIESKLTCQDMGVSYIFYNKDKKRVRNLLAILVFFFPHPNPYLKKVSLTLKSSFLPKYTVSIQINYLFTIIAQSRVFFLLKFFLLSTPYYSSRLRRVCEQNSCKLSLIFSLKSLIKKSPKTVIGCFSVAILFFCLYALRVIEREFETYTGRDYNYSVALWYLIITGTTTGYGDFYPISDIGRAIGIFFCIFGSIMISITITTLEIFENLEGIESQIYTLVNRIEEVTDETFESKVTITMWLRLSQNLVNGRINTENNATKVERDSLLYQIFKLKEKKKLNLMENPLNDKSKTLYIEISRLTDSVNKLGKQTAEISNKANLIASFLDNVIQTNSNTLDKKQESFKTFLYGYKESNEIFDYSNTGIESNDQKSDRTLADFTKFDPKKYN